MKKTTKTQTQADRAYEQLDREMSEKDRAWWAAVAKEELKGAQQ